MPFNHLTALKYAQELAYPRRVGSPGEASARAFLAGRLASLGYEVEQQQFECSTGADLAVALLIGAAQVLIVVTFWAWGGWRGLGVLPALLLLALAISSGRLIRLATGSVLRSVQGVPDASEAGGPAPGWAGAVRWLGRLGRRYKTANVIARPRQPAGAEQPEWIFVAHWDTKSQALPLPVRMGLIGLAGLSAVLFAGLTLVRTVWMPATAPGALAGLVALVAGVPVLLLYLAGSGNASPGAIDNASGAAMVLHLAEHFASEHPALRATFLITGAEEFGLLGAIAFVRAAQLRRAWPEPNRVHVLNFDGVGTDGPLAYVGAETAPLAQAVTAAGRELGLAVGRLPLVGALFDHMPFAEAGLDAISLVTTGAAARRVHTPGDSAEQLSEEGFWKAGEVVGRVVSGNW